MTFSPGTNYYFDNFNNQGEQDLWEDLVIEMIKIYGCDMYYLPKTLRTYDPIYGEDPLKHFSSAIPLECYIKSVDGFEGDGEFLSKFGLEIRDQVTLTVAKRVFEEEVGARADESRPNEGDLIYFPLNQKLFVIRFVNYKPFFYQHGKLQTYDLVCELFEYSNETINTGIPEIDEVQKKFSVAITDYSLLMEDGTTMLMTEDDNFIVREQYIVSNIQPGTDNENIQNEQEGDQSVTTDDVIDWTELDPFSTGRY